MSGRGKRLAARRAGAENWIPPGENPSLDRKALERRLERE